MLSSEKFLEGSRQPSMNLNKLPRDLVQFVQQEIAQGAYQSAAEVVSAALRLLREHEAQHGNPQSPTNGYPDALPHAPEEIITAIAQALASDHHVLARQLALDGAKQYPDHDQLQKYGRILAPPTVGTPIPTTLEARTALKANNAWLKAHWQAYRGHWVALQAGHLLHASPSCDDVVAHVGAVRGRDILLTKIT
jgi:putative addiction module CopG family antidote